LQKKSRLPDLQAGDAFFALADRGANALAHTGEESLIARDVLEQYTAKFRNCKSAFIKSSRALLLKCRRWTVITGDLLKQMTFLGLTLLLRRGLDQTGFTG